MIVHGGQALNFAVPVEASKELLTKAGSSTLLQPLAKETAIEKKGLWNDAEFKAANSAMLVDPEKLGACSKQAGWRLMA